MFFKGAWWSTVSADSSYSASAAMMQLHTVALAAGE